MPTLTLADVRLDLPGKGCRCRVFGSLRFLQPELADLVHQGDTVVIDTGSHPRGQLRLRVERVEGNDLIVSR